MFGTPADCTANCATLPGMSASLTEGCVAAFEAYASCAQGAACMTEGDGAYSGCVSLYEARAAACSGG